MNYTRLGQIGLVILGTVGTCNNLQKPKESQDYHEVDEEIIEDTTAEISEKIQKIIEIAASKSEKDSKLTLTQQEERFTEDCFQILEILKAADIHFMGYGRSTEDGMPYTVLWASHHSFGYGLNLPDEKNIDENFRYNVRIRMFQEDPNSDIGKEILNQVIRTNSRKELVDTIKEIMAPTYFLEQEDQ